MYINREAIIDIARIFRLFLRKLIYYIIRCFISNVAMCKIRFDEKKIVQYFRTFSPAIFRDFVASFRVLRNSRGWRRGPGMKRKTMRRLADILYTVMAISRALRSWAQEGVFREEEWGVQFAGNRTVWPVTSFPKMILSNPITHVIARHYFTRWVITIWPVVLPGIRQAHELFRDLKSI